MDITDSTNSTLTACSVCMYTCTVQKKHMFTIAVVWSNWLLNCVWAWLAV